MPLGATLLPGIVVEGLDGVGDLSGGGFSSFWCDPVVNPGRGRRIAVLDGRWLSPAALFDPPESFQMAEIPAERRIPHFEQFVRDPIQIVLLSFLEFLFRVSRRTSPDALLFF